MIKNYGNRQTYFIDSIDYNSNPTCTLANTKETYEQYYLRKHKIQINNLTQPLITATPRPNAQGPPTVLIPELIALQDRSRRPDYPAELDRRIGKLKKLTPAQKESHICDTVSSLAAEDIIKKSALKIEAVSLSTPTLSFSNSEVLPEEGVF